MILCLGPTPTLQRTMTFDRLALDQVNRTDQIQTTASGKSTNVARVLKTIGEEVICTGFVGGRAGEMMRTGLDAVGIVHDYVEVEPETRTCITLIDRSSHHATELVEEAQPVRESDWQALLGKVDRLIGNADLLVLSGSLPHGGPVDFYARCIEIASKRKVRTIVDAQNQPLLNAVRARPFLVKPNRTELLAAMPGETSWQSAAKKLVEMGSTWALITMGKEGAALTDGRKFWSIRMPPMDVISPIGSGDAFAAGIAAGIVRSLQMLDAARLGCACATANALIPVAGHLRAEDVRRLLPQVFVEEMKG